MILHAPILHLSTLPSTPEITMMSPKSLPFAAALLLSTAVDAQVYRTGDRSSDAFTWVQPEDAVVLDQYNHSEPVYPSREYTAPMI